MEKFVSVCLTRSFSLWLIVFCSPAVALQWQPLCIEGSSCDSPYQVILGGGTQGYHPIDPSAAGPLVTTEGVLLHHTPLEFPVIDLSKPAVRHIFQLSTSGMENLGGGFGYVSDTNAIQSSTGRTLSFWLQGAIAWFIPDEGTVSFNWSGRDVINFNNAEFTGPPVEVDNIIYVGIRGAGAQSIYMSADDGNNWTENVADIRIGEDRFNLMENPETNALWAIHSEFFEDPGSLWESADHGSTWWQVDDGSFPANAVRVVHDPDDPMASYALTNHGLFVSVDRGVSWQLTSMTDPVHGMVFVERMLGLSRALIVGTDTGVWVSVNEAASWVSMGRGLPAIPHTVTYGHGQLIATSDAGYFACNAVDCAGLATPVEIEATDGTFNNRVRVSWKPVEGTTVYRVFRCPDNDVKSCGFPVRFPRGTVFADYKATPGIVYHYRVRACTTNGCSNFSAANTGYISLATPTDIKASDGTFDDHVRVSWKPVDGATVYRVFRCPDTGISRCGLPIGFPHEPFFDDTKATAGMVFHYRVRACSSDMCSAFSETNTGYTN